MSSLLGNKVYNEHLINKLYLIYIGIGIGIKNFVADISAIRILVKTHISATLPSLSQNVMNTS